MKREDVENLAQTLFGEFSNIHVTPTLTDLIADHDPQTSAKAQEVHRAVLFDINSGTNPNEAGRFQLRIEGGRNRFEVDFHVSRESGNVSHEITSTRLMKTDEPIRRLVEVSEDSYVRWFVRSGPPVDVIPHVLGAQKVRVVEVGDWCFLDENGWLEGPFEDLDDLEAWDREERGEECIETFDFGSDAPGVGGLARLLSYRGKLEWTDDGGERTPWDGTSDEWLDYMGDMV